VSYALRRAGLVVASVCLLSIAACNSGSSAASTASASTAGGGRGGGRGAGGAGGAVVPVVLGKVSQKDVPVDISSIGNVEAFSTISVRSQLTGTLTEVRFREGDYVKKDAVLFEIDPRPYRAAVDQANANMARDVALENQAEAQLARDIANADYTRAQAQRNGELMKRGIISKDQADQTSAAAQAADANVNADRANIASAKAQIVSEQASVDSAKLQLEYTVIRSPIDGRSGNLTIKAGNLVAANSTELVTLTQLDPIYVTFSMPAVNLPAIKEHMAQGQLAVSATPQTTGAPRVLGTLTFVDNSVDPSTDTIRLKATFGNADHTLWPGQFSSVSVRLATIPNATVVPTEAVQTGQDGQFVFVVKADSTVEQRTVTTGAAVDQDTVIKTGLNVGETVVTEGQLRLDAGTRVTRADPKTGEAAPAGNRGRGGRGTGTAVPSRNGQPAPASSNGSE
jgi:multidrug efflux system membrane fusion protein